MTDHEPRLFDSLAAIRRVAEGLLDHSLPAEEWTHEAHLAATAYLLCERPDLDLDAEIRTIISSFNAAKGTVNDDHGGYHDTITRCYLTGIRSWLAGHRDGPLAERINGLLRSERGRRDWPLRFYSRERLFSAEARRTFVAPDLERVAG